MPELIILISAVVCAAAAIVLYYNRSSAIAAGATVLGFVAFLYGIGQHIERGNPQTKVPSFGDLANQRAATKPSPAPEERPKPQQPATETRGERESLDAIGASARPAAVPEANPSASSSAGVVISHFTAERIPPRDIAVSVTFINNNPFPVKNIVLRCGDRSYATGDVTALVDKVVPPRSNLRVTALRMGPIRPELPPTICLVDKFDRAD